MSTICTDFQAECEALAMILDGLDAVGWDTPTPAPGWLVRDQMSHLGWTDRSALMALTEPERFTAEILQQPRQTRAAQQHATGRAYSGEALLAWWRTGREALLAALRLRDPKDRIPWFGPSMSALSCATARLMETWAHGQDIVDALQVHRPATERLRHIAHLGVLTRAFSYRTRGEEPPAAEIRVELQSPAGDLWTWGARDTEHSICGPALDFCLVVTQRRHPADTALQLRGALATAWMERAQAFAGPPGAGRQPRQFS
ncbi:MAG: TIGR03084 family protein [Candidatus Tectomicrobia bacterium]|uniref:TIGR03084 family protein n=1 Tax=Tectimicrobiota bacterium TaxID=2528274 RepID=A0A937W0K7_UNCTE|nr:TIGR03084 family protein [Candidatus Tectomicrobia bacterium]